MGLGAENDISTYFSANCDADDAKLANAFLDSQKVSAYEHASLQGRGRKLLSDKPRQFQQPPIKHRKHSKGPLHNTSLHQQVTFIWIHVHCISPWQPQTEL
jgi:hypothetical protein